MLKTKNKTSSEKKIQEMVFNKLSVDEKIGSMTILNSLKIMNIKINSF